MNIEIFKCFGAPLFFQKPSTPHSESFIKPEYPSIQHDFGLSPLIPPPFFTLESGPINKSAPTIKLEYIVKILLKQVPHCRCTFSNDGPFSELWVSVHDDHQQTVEVDNLSMLVQKAHLGHLELNDEDKKAFESQLVGQGYRLDEKKIKEIPESLRKLPYWVFLVMKQYTASGYLSMNRLLYAGKCLASIAPSVLLFCCFQAAALKELTLHYGSGQMSEPMKPLHKLYRVDPLDWNHACYGGGARLLNFTGFTSTTTVKNNHETETNIKIVNPPAFLPALEDLSVYKFEHEVLLPPGTQVIWQHVIEHHYLGTIVNTPQTFGLSYHAALALRFAFRANHFGSDPLFAKAMRPIFYLDLIIPFFMRNAANPEFRDYCWRISEEEKEVLQMALSFVMTTGSSVPSEDHTSKLQCATDFAAFASERNISPELIKRFSRLMLFLNHSTFVNEINIPTLEDYHPEDNFLFHLMTFACQLDSLSQCSIDTFQTNMNEYSSTPLIHPASKTFKGDLWSLIRYAIHCVQETQDIILDNDYYRTYAVIPTKVFGFFCQSDDKPKTSLDPIMVERTLNQVERPSFAFFKRMANLTRANDLLSAAVCS